MIPEFFFDFRVQKLGWALIHFLWQGTAIAAVYAMLRAACAWIISMAESRWLLRAVVAIWLSGVIAFSIRLLCGWRDGIRRSQAEPAGFVPQPRYFGLDLKPIDGRWRGKVVALSLTFNLRPR